MKKKRLIAYALALSSLLGCNKKEDTFHTQDKETPHIEETIQISNPTQIEETTEYIEQTTNETQTPVKEEITKAGFAICNITVYDENNNIIKEISQYDILTILNYQETEQGLTNVILEDGSIVNIDYMFIQTLPKTYVEVDISKQKLYCYYEEQLVLEADVVTGNPNIGTTPGTNLGYTETNGKLYETYLMGNSYVDIFISFNSDGEGFHNAPWRNEFGGEIYKTNGSHGCVNMKYEDVVILDQYTNNTGTKVLIHK